MTSWSVQAHATFFTLGIFQIGIELYLDNFDREYVMGLRSGAYEPVSIKAGMVIDATKVNLIPL